MNEKSSVTSSTSELKAFVTFLGSLWGALASLSVLFPLSDQLIGVLPLAAHDDDGALVKIPPGLITVVTTIAALFAVFWIFSRREQIRDRQSADGMRRQALLAFGGGIALLVGYIILYEVKLEDSFDSWGWESDSSLHLLAEVPLLLLYAGFFALLTSAFVLLGLLEFLRKSPEVDQT